MIGLYLSAFQLLQTLAGRPGDLPECRRRPPRHNQDPVHPLPDRSAGWTLSPSGRTDRRWVGTSNISAAVTESTGGNWWEPADAIWEMAAQGKTQVEPGPHCGGGEEAGQWPRGSGGQPGRRGSSSSTMGMGCQGLQLMGRSGCLTGAPWWAWS